MIRAILGSASATLEEGEGFVMAGARLAINTFATLPGHHIEISYLES